MLLRCRQILDRSGPGNNKKFTGRRPRTRPASSRHALPPAVALPLQSWLPAAPDSDCTALTATVLKSPTGTSSQEMAAVAATTAEASKLYDIVRDTQLAVAKTTTGTRQCSDAKSTVPSRIGTPFALALFCAWHSAFGCRIQLNSRAYYSYMLTIASVKLIDQLFSVIACFFWSLICTAFPAFPTETMQLYFGGCDDRRHHRHQ